jgi:hypothetical protein
MKLRDFVTVEKIKSNVAGRDHLPIWDAELSDEDLAKLNDAPYMAKLADEHREMQAYNLARYGNAKYEPASLAKRIKVPEIHIWAYWALHGSRGTGLYS